MKNTLSYKGYIGSINFSEEDMIFFGKVLGIKSAITFEGDSVSSLIEDFHFAVDDYLEICDSEGIEPEKAYKGSFNVRISPELHQRAAAAADAAGISLNSFVEKSIQNYL